MSRHNGSTSKRKTKPQMKKKDTTKARRRRETNKRSEGHDIRRRDYNEVA